MKTIIKAETYNNFNNDIKEKIDNLLENPKTEKIWISNSHNLVAKVDNQIIMIEENVSLESQEIYGESKEIDISKLELSDYINSVNIEPYSKKKNNLTVDFKENNSFIIACSCIVSKNANIYEAIKNNTEVVFVNETILKKIYKFFQQDFKNHGYTKRTLNKEIPYIKTSERLKYLNLYEGLPVDFDISISGRNFQFKYGCDTFKYNIDTKKVIGSSNFCKKIEKCLETKCVEKKIKEFSKNQNFTFKGINSFNQYFYNTTIKVSGETVSVKFNNPYDEENIVEVVNKEIQAYKRKKGKKN